jgi:hypothetical protein
MSLLREYINEISVEELQASQDAAAEQHGVSQQNTGGDCYQAAGRYMMDECLAADRCDDLILVHGEVAGQGALEGMTYGHAWVLGNGMVIDKANGRDLEIPQPLYYAIGQINYIGNTIEYTWEEARKKILEYGHWGPWDLETESGL